MFSLSVIFITLSDNMNSVISDMLLLKKHELSMDHLFRIGDLEVLLHAQGKNLHNRIKRLIDNELLESVCRGLYGTAGWTLESASARVYPDSFVSGPTMLAEYRMIGTLPSHRIFCIKTGLPRQFATPLGELDFHSTQPHQMFGFTRQGFVQKAEPERALLDTLYYHLRGEHFFFDLYSDVHVGDLNVERYTEYLQRFRNPRFKVFASEYYRSRS